VKKKLCIILLFVIMVLSAGAETSACTGFAVYGENTFYGMNFDFDLETEVRFKVQPMEDGFVFLGSFHWDTGWMESWLDFVGYNSHGLFATLQMVPPRDPEDISGPTMYVPELKARSLAAAKNLDGVMEILGNARLLPVAGFYLHSLYADIHGQAAVIEAGVEKNHIFPIENGFVVMTNFYHHEVDPRALEDLEVEGIDEFERYLVAEEMIGEKMPDFSWRDGFEVLAAVCVEPYTRSSVIINPEDNIVYLSIESDFSRIWKLDLHEKTIETLEGFAEHRREEIPEDGLLSSYLLEWE